MDELEIKIVLSYKVPENALTLNRILRGLQEDENTLMRKIAKAILATSEKKVVEEYISSCPYKYYRYGRQTGHGSLSPLPARSATDRPSSITGKQKRYFLHSLKRFRFFLINSIREKHWKGLWDK